MNVLHTTYLTGTGKLDKSDQPAIVNHTEKLSSIAETGNAANKVFEQDFTHQLSRSQNYWLVAGEKLAAAILWLKKN